MGGLPLTDEDRKRADRIGVLSARLWRLEELLAAVGSDTRPATISVGIGTIPGQVSAIPPVVLRGVEAERLLAGMIDDMKGELQALLL